MANVYDPDETKDPDVIEANKAAKDATALAEYTEKMDAYKAAIEKRKRLIADGNYGLAVQVDVPTRPPKFKPVPRLGK